MSWLILYVAGIIVAMLGFWGGLMPNVHRWFWDGMFAAGLAFVLAALVKVLTE